MSLIPEAISRVLDLVVGLAGMPRRKRKATFDVLSQIFALLGEIHEGYLALLEGARDACPTPHGEGRWAYLRDGKPVVVKTRATVKKQIEAMKKGIYETRRATEKNRVLLRANIGSCLRAKLGTEEKRFVWAMAKYLLYPDSEANLNPNVVMIDAEIDLITWKDSVQEMRTPSNRFANELEKLSDPDAILDLIDEFDRTLRGRWALVARFWSELQMAIAQKTTSLT